MELVVFNFGAAEVRTVIKDGLPWWVAGDVCVILGIDATQTRRLDEDEKGLHSIQTLGGSQEMTVINESGLYSLILRSRKKGARDFKKWVTSEVLPTIRKTGSYSVAQAINPNDLLSAVVLNLTALTSGIIETKAITAATVARVDDVEAKLLTETQAREAYEAEHHLDRVQQYVRSFTDVKIQVVGEQLKRDPSANARQLYSRFTNEMKILANVATSKAGELSVSGAKRCLVAAQTLAKRYGVPVVVQMPIAQEQEATQ